MARTIKATMPSGEVVELEGVPETATEAQIKAKIQGKLGEAPTELGGDWLDTAKLAGSAAVRGIASLGGMAQDVVRNTKLGMLETAEALLGKRKFGETQPLMDKFKHTGEIAAEGTQPINPGQRYASSITEGAAGGLVGGVGGLVRSALIGAAGGLGAEAAGTATSQNPLARIAAALLVGGATGIATGAKTSRADIARETLRDAKEADLDQAVATMRGQQQAFAERGVENSGINLSQAMPQSSNVDAMVEKLANSRHGTHTTAQLRAQPSQTSALVEGELAGLPGTQRPWQDLANRAQEASTKLIRLEKDEASARWGRTFDAKLGEMKARAAELQRVAKEQLNSARGAYNSALADDAGVNAERWQAHKQAVDKLQKDYEEALAAVKQQKAAHEAALAEPPPIPTGIGSKQGILLDDRGRGQAVSNALAGYEARKAQLTGKGVVVGEDGKPLAQAPKFPEPASPTLPPKPELAKTAEGAGRGLAAAQRGMQLANGQMAATKGVPAERVEAVIADLLQKAEAAGPKTTKARVLRQLAQGLRGSDGEVITDGVTLNEVLKNAAGMAKPSTLASRGLDAAASGYLQKQVLGARDKFGEALKPFKEANSAFRGYTEAVVEPLKKSVIGDIAGRAGAQPDRQAVVGHLTKVFEQGTTPGGARSEILTLQKNLQRTDPEAYTDAAKSWLAEKITKAAAPTDNRFPEDFSRKLIQAFGSETATVTEKSKGLQDVLVGMARAQGQPDDAFLGLPKLMQYIASSARRPKGFQGASSVDFDRIAGSPTANALARGSVFNPFRPALIAMDNLLRGDAYQFVDKLITSPEGVEVLRTLAKSSPHDKKTQAALATFAATITTGTPKPNQPPAE